MSTNVRRSHSDLLSTFFPCCRSQYLGSYLNNHFLTRERVPKKVISTQGKWKGCAERQTSSYISPKIFEELSAERRPEHLGSFAGAIFQDRRLRRNEESYVHLLDKQPVPDMMLNNRENSSFSLEYKYSKGLLGLIQRSCTPRRSFDDSF